MQTYLFWKLLIQGNLQSFLKKQLKTATLPHSPPNSELQGLRSKMVHTRQPALQWEPGLSRTVRPLHSLFEPLSYPCSYFRDTTIRISHIFMNRFSEKWIAIIGLTMRNLVDLGEVFSIMWWKEFIRLTVLYYIKGTVLGGQYMCVLMFMPYVFSKNVIKRDLQWSCFTFLWTSTKSPYAFREELAIK